MDKLLIRNATLRKEGHGVAGKEFEFRVGSISAEYGNVHVAGNGIFCSRCILPRFAQLCLAIIQVILGILLTLLMLKCGESILVPICCHAGFNGGSYLLELVLGEGNNLPLMLAVYFFSIALTIIVGYLIFRTPAEEIEE